MSDISDRVEHMMRVAEEQAQKAGELQDAVENVRGTATSADGSVTVTVSPSGALLDLRLSPQVSRQSHTVIQRTIMSTISEAGRRASEALRDAASSALGDQIGHFQYIVDAVTASSGASSEGDSQQRDRSDDGGDFEAGSFLR